jgi:ribosomal protein L10
MDRIDKDAQIERYRTWLKQVPALVVLEARNINGRKHEEVRRLAKQHGWHWQMVKNTLARLACANTGRSTLAEHFDGPSIVVSLQDDWHPSLSALVTYLQGDFLRHIPVSFGSGTPPRPRPEPHVRIKAGWIEGRLRLSDELVSIARLPSLEQSRRALMALLLMPARQLARVIDQRAEAK